MAPLAPPPIHLHRIDASSNMARFYQLTLEFDLFGATVVRKTWGRIGTRGQTMTVVVEHTDDGIRTANTIADTKRRRGYVDLKASP